MDNLGGKLLLNYVTEIRRIHFLISALANMYLNDWARNDEALVDFHAPDISAIIIQLLTNSTTLSKGVEDCWLKSLKQLCERESKIEEARLKKVRDSVNIEERQKPPSAPAPIETTAQKQSSNGEAGATSVGESTASRTQEAKYPTLATLYKRFEDKVFVLNSNTTDLYFSHTSGRLTSQTGHQPPVTISEGEALLIIDSRRVTDVNYRFKWDHESSCDQKAPVLPQLNAGPMFCVVKNPACCGYYIITLNDYYKYIKPGDVMTAGPESNVLLFLYSNEHKVFLHGERESEELTKKVYPDGVQPGVDFPYQLEKDVLYIPLTAATNKKSSPLSKAVTATRNDDKLDIGSLPIYLTKSTVCLFGIKDDRFQLISYTKRVDL